MSIGTTAASPVDEVISQAMRKPEDRIFFLQYEALMLSFVLDTTRPTLDLPPMNTYQRLLVRRCADQFALSHHLDRLSHAVTLSKTVDSFSPAALLSDRAKAVDTLDSSTASSSSASTPPPPQTSITPPLNFKIMRRDPSSSGRVRSSRDNSDSETATSRSRKDMTIQEREASYKAARARIFGQEEALNASDSTSNSINDTASPRASGSEEIVSPSIPSPSTAYMQTNLWARAPAFVPPSVTASRSATDQHHTDTSNVSQRQQMNGVGAWAQQTANFNQYHQQMASTSGGRTGRSQGNGTYDALSYNRDFPNCNSASSAPSSTSSRQSNRNTTTTKSALAAHPSLPSKPSWLQPNKDPSLSSTHSSASASPLPVTHSTLHSPTNVLRDSQ